jgi:hypothetical protein
MPVITVPPEHLFPWYVRLFFWNQKRRYGAVLESARLWAAHPRYSRPWHCSTGL